MKELCFVAGGERGDNDDDGGDDGDDGDSADDDKVKTVIMSVKLRR